MENGNSQAILRSVKRESLHVKRKTAKHSCSETFHV
jgi:hypothetical protein